MSELAKAVDGTCDAHHLAVGIDNIVADNGLVVISKVKSKPSLNVRNF